MMKINLDQVPIHVVRNVYLNNNVYICSGSQSPLPFLSPEVPHSYRPQEKHEMEVQEVHFSNTTLLLRLCAMHTDVINISDYFVAMVTWLPSQPQCYANNFLSWVLLSSYLV